MSEQTSNTKLYAERDVPLDRVMEHLRDIHADLIGQGNEWTYEGLALAHIERLRRELAKPPHEREAPHCSNCSCPPYDAEALQNE